MREGKGIVVSKIKSEIVNMEKTIVGHSRPIVQIFPLLNPGVKPL